MHVIIVLQVKSSFFLTRNIHFFYRRVRREHREKRQDNFVHDNFKNIVF